jgi:hypothetical protein
VKPTNAAIVDESNIIGRLGIDWPTTDIPIPPVALRKKPLG